MTSRIENSKGKSNEIQTTGWSYKMINRYRAVIPAMGKAEIVRSVSKMQTKGLEHNLSGRSLS
jgi:hypothetical protein